MPGDSRDAILHQPYPVTAGMDAYDAKGALRRAIHERRSARTSRQRTQAATAFADVLDTIAAVRSARCVAAYASRATEPCTSVLLERLAAEGKQVLLPVLGSGLARDWAEFTSLDDLRERAPGRPPEPSGPALGTDAVAMADVVVAPALAVDTHGRRLGQGGGWYDRVLPLVREGVTVVALVYADEVYDGDARPLPTEPHDRPVAVVATPEGWRELGA